MIAPTMADGYAGPCYFPYCLSLRFSLVVSASVHAGGKREALGTIIASGFGNGLAGWKRRGPAEFPLDTGVRLQMEPRQLRHAPALLRLWPVDALFSWVGNAVPGTGQ